MISPLPSEYEATIGEREGRNHYYRHFYINKYDWWHLDRLDFLVSTLFSKNAGSGNLLVQKIIGIKSSAENY
jgi:hypothetical protein